MKDSSLCIKVVGGMEVDLSSQIGHQSIHLTHMSKSDSRCSSFQQPRSSLVPVQDNRNALIIFQGSIVSE
jgi:hypothetical protein